MSELVEQVSLEEKLLFLKQLKEKFKDYKPKWSKLGWIVFKRTYARQMYKINNEWLYDVDLTLEQKQQMPELLKQNLVQQRTEEFYECVYRCIKSAIEDIKVDYTLKDIEDLYQYHMDFVCSVSGRALWQLGSKLIKEGYRDSLYNCYGFTMNKKRAFLQVFEMLMLGGGCGFNITKKEISKLPKVKEGISINHIESSSIPSETVAELPEEIKENGGFYKVSYSNGAIENVYFVGDSRKGWVNLLDNILTSFLESGNSFNFSTVLIRAKGQPIYGFGGVSSGDSDLISGMKQIIEILKQASSRNLKPIEVLDVICLIASIVISGNVRRSALIAVGDPDDTEYLVSKRWDLGNVPHYRGFVNISVNCSDVKELHPLYWETYKKNGESIGLVNLKNCQNFGRMDDGFQEGIDKDADVVNPCQPAFAKLLTPNGFITMGDLQIGDTIWSREGWTEVLDKWSTGNKQVYKYSSNSSFFIGTSNHRVESKGIKTPIKEAKLMDICRGIDEYPVKTDIETFIKGVIYNSFEKDNEGFIIIKKKDYAEMPEVVKQHIVEERKYTKFARTVVSKYIMLKFKDEFYNITQEEIDSFSLSELKSFFSGMVAYNLSTQFRGGTTRGYIFCKDMKTMEFLQLLLNVFDVDSYMVKEYKNNPPRINLIKDVQKLLDLVTFIPTYKKENFVSFKEAPRKYARKIKKTEYLGVHEVFDITVSNESHTYWTEGTSVSNCGEITLNGDKGEGCLLGELYMPNITSYEMFFNASRLLYMLNKHISQGKFLYPSTQEVTNTSSRIGLSQTGILQSLEKVQSWSEMCYKELRKFDIIYSQQHGYNTSIKLTTVQPHGTKSLMAGVTAGIHPAYAEYYFRTIRFDVDDKLWKLCQEAGLNVEDSMFLTGYKTPLSKYPKLNNINKLLLPIFKYFGKTEAEVFVNPKTKVAYFPMKVDENAVLAKDVDSIQQLEYSKMMQDIWSDNSVSCTIYYDKQNLNEIKQWLEVNLSKIKTVSLLAFSHEFMQSPYININANTYSNALEKFTPFDEKFVDDSETLLAENTECAGGFCSLR